jgi:hypothetical protein
MKRVAKFPGTLSEIPLSPPFPKGENLSSPPFKKGRLGGISGGLFQMTKGIQFFSTLVEFLV